jgi:hexosaminidase
VTLVAVTTLAGAAEGPPDHPSGEEIAIRFELLENQHQGANQFRAELVLANRGDVALADPAWALYFNFGRPISSASPAVGLTVEHVNGDLWKLSASERFEPLLPGEERRVPLLGRGAVTRLSDAPAGPYFVFGDGGVEAVADYSISPFGDLEKLRRAPGDETPTATPAWLFERNRDLEQLPAEKVGRIVPTPVWLESGSGIVTLDPTWKIRHAPGLANEAAFLADALEPLLGSRIETAENVHSAVRSIVLRTAAFTVDGSSRRPGDEAYRLTVEPGGSIVIAGTDPAGVLYGIQTLRALLPIEPPDTALELPQVSVEDAPRFPYRGLHLDVARNFQGRETVERLLDLAAFYKLNRFHFHLTDDEGWRLPVAALPELTSVGGRRGHTTDESDWLVPSFGSGPDPDPAVSHGSGHYTRADFVAILRFARDRHIRVIPEIDVPGHARAAIKAMAARHARLSASGDNDEAEAFLLAHPADRSEYRSVQGWDDNVIDVCMPSTYRFLETVIDEIIGLYAEAGAPLETVHVGGDEVPAGVWQGSPACERLLQEDPDLTDSADLWGHFLRRVSVILAERGLATAGWEEIALTAGAHGTVKQPNEEFLDRHFRPYVWNNVWGWGAEDLGYKLANAGYEVVLCNATNLYFDLAYEKHPEELGYAWAGFVDTRKAWEFVPLDLFKNARTNLMGRPIDAAAFAGRARLSDAGRRRVRGLQGQLWAENSKSPAILDYQAFPKLLGLAERAWAAQPGWARIEDAAERQLRQDLAWNEFANRLGQRELPRLDRLNGGILYRLPPPGAVFRDGLVTANTAFPGLVIRYTTDGSEPTASSELYTEPLAVSGDVKLRTFDTRGRGSRTATAAAAE